MVGGFGHRPFSYHHPPKGAHPRHHPTRRMGRRCRSAKLMAAQTSGEISVGVARGPKNCLRCGRHDRHKVTVCERKVNQGCGEQAHTTVRENLLLRLGDTGPHFETGPHRRLPGAVKSRKVRKLGGTGYGSSGEAASFSTRTMAASGDASQQRKQSIFPTRTCALTHVGPYRPYTKGCMSPMNSSKIGAISM